MSVRRSGLLLVAITIHCLLIISTVAGSRKRQAAQGYRLPENVEPQNYSLEILTNLDPANFSFEGKVLIKLKCVKAGDEIILHSKELDIAEKEVTLKQIIAANETVDVPIISHAYTKENDFYIITLGQRLVQGAVYRLYIPFRGTLNEGLAGFYRSSYHDDKTNTTKWLAVTQFESTEARRAFPCFDEPALKATFSITIGHAKNFKATSNMPLKGSKPLKNKPDWVLDKFMETMPMSTYLVAFMVSEFEYKEAPKTDSNVTFRIWVRKTALDQAELAKEVGPKVLAYYETYFNTKYPLPKQDMAAIPDFSFGAMENWGLITYRETALLYDPKSSSIFNKERVASVIAHELAHQWFGNLVTMKWWTDLWLNEGFATYVGALGVHHVFPEWNSLDETFINDFMAVLSLDELKSSHPVSVPIGHPSEIEQIFDTISYEKGSYLIRMMNMFLGEDVFQKSVTNYLQKHKCGNAAQDDLWEALTETAHAQGVLQSNITVKMIMDTWTLQTGFPVVTVTRDYEKGTVTVAQERYVSATDSENKKPRQAESPCWWVPLSYTDGNEMRFTDTKPKKWLTCDGPLTFTTDATKEQWLLFNLKASGLYRVNYDEKNWMMLKDTLMDDAGFKNVDTLSRVQLISDMLSFAWNGRLDYGTVFSVLTYLKHENEHLPWRTALSGLDAINRMLRRTPTLGYFKRVLRELLEPSYAKIGRITDVPTEYEAIRQHWLIVSWSCYSGVMDCEDQSSELFKAWYEESNPDENNPIPNDLRSVVYCRSLKHGGERYWEFLWQRYEKSNVASDKQEILSALGCVNELWLLQRYLQWSLNSTKVRKQDSLSVFSSVASNEIGYLAAKSFFVRQFTNIRNYHDAKSSSLSSYIRIITNQMTTPEELNEFQNFTLSVSQYLKGAEISVKQGLEAASNNIHWHSMHYEKISDMFRRE